MNKKNADGILFMFAGMLFLLAAIINNNYLFITLGCCFVVLGISISKNKK